MYTLIALMYTLIMLMYQVNDVDLYVNTVKSSMDIQYVDNANGMIGYVNNTKQWHSKFPQVNA